MSAYCSTCAANRDNLPRVAEAELKALLERHVELYNDAVKTGDYRPYLANFSDNAVMRFDGTGGGLFTGRGEIGQVHAAAVPADTIALIDMQVIGRDAVDAVFEWDAGGTGQMRLRWDAGRLVELVLAEAA